MRCVLRLTHRLEPSLAPATLWVLARVSQTTNNEYAALVSVACQRPNAVCVTLLLGLQMLLTGHSSEVNLWCLLARGFVASLGCGVVCIAASESSLRYARRHALRSTTRPTRCQFSADARRSAA